MVIFGGWYSMVNTPPVWTQSTEVTGALKRREFNPFVANGKHSSQ